MGRGRLDGGGVIAAPTFPNNSEYGRGADFAMKALEQGNPSRAYSYREDPSVPAFPDDRPIIIFDGHCVLCSRFARFVLRHDRRAVITQGPGQLWHRTRYLDSLEFRTANLDSAP